MGFWNAIGSVFGTISNNRNVDKQLAAQKQENQDTREWNLMLAEKQNAWNQQQWNLQNAYNSPTAQMERMRQAGLNPDMMYGGGVGGNTSSSSPEMTSGAPGLPMDWSALSTKKTISDAILLNAQLEQMDAQTEKIKSETKGQDITNNIQAFESEIKDLMREEGYQGSIALARAKYEEYKSKSIELQYKTEQEKFKYLVDSLEHDKAVREFERSLHKDKQQLFTQMVREAIATANLKVFADQMKEAGFWIDKGIEAFQSVSGAVGAVGKFKNPTEILKEYHSYGDQTITVNKN